MTSPQSLHSPDDPWAPGGLAALRTSFPFTAQVTIADNGSTDGTWPLALDLERMFSEVRAVQLAQPGRGWALRARWSASLADVVAHMDVDLSTDLNALPPLVTPLLLRITPGARFSDAQCGFKAIRSDRARALLVGAASTVAYLLLYLARAAQGHAHPRRRTR